MVHLCDRLRKSRSILSVHFTDNPGLMEPNLESTIFNLLKCREKQGPEIKLDVNNQIDFALNSNMMERLQKQL